MDYRPNYYSNRNAIDKSNRYKKKRIFWLNSSFNSDFVLIDNKIYEISWDIPSFEIYKNNRLKLLTYIRDSNQSKPIQIKLKLPLTQSRDIINTDKEAFPIIYTNHSAVEAMTYGSNPIIRLIPQQITRFTFRLDDNFNQLDYNSYFTSITNGSVFQVAGGSPDDKYIIFKSSGSFVLDKNLNCDFFMIGGGGAGGHTHGGGGGAGAYYYGINQNLSSGTYTITVGAGGLKGDGGATVPTNGGNTSISLGGTIIYSVNGGGAGGYSDTSGTANVVSRTGKNGGCGGGAGSYNGGATPTNTAIPAGSASNSGTNGNGFNGGTGYADMNAGVLSGGGGGGIGEIGANATTASTGNGAKGGSGLIINITGFPIAYGGGGGGGVWGDSRNPNLDGGLGGDAGGFIIGGKGGKNLSFPATSGVVNTGSGGGGGSSSGGIGGDGGSGVVIIRFKEIRNEGITAEENLIQATNNSITVNTDSKYVINYQNPVNIPKGTYETIFANGGITFKSKPDYNYPTTSKNPIVWYKFDGSQLLYDSSGNNNLINNNGVSIDTSIYTRGNSSALFNPSTSSYFTMPKLNYNTINTTNGISFSFWGRFKSTTGTYAAVFQFIGSGGHCLLYRDGGNNFAFYNEIVSPADVKYITTSGINNFDNTWRHYTWTISTTGIWNIYINGSATNNNFSGNVISSGLNANQSYVSSIGRRTDTNHNIDGNIDDFRIFDYVLSPYEVYDLYNGNTDRSYPILKDANNTTINPYVWHQFDTGSLLINNGTSGINLTSVNVAPTADTTNFIKGTSSALLIRNTTTANYLTSIVNLTTPFTISFWFNINNANNNSPFGLGADDTSPAISCTYNSSTNKIVTYLATPNTWNTILTSTATININTWYHYTLIITNANPVVCSLYINGVLDTSGSGVGAFSTNNKNLRIGVRGDLAAVDSFGGYIDDFRIYQQVLTATQVSELYNGRISIYNPPAFLTGFELEDEDLFKENTISSYK